MNNPVGPMFNLATQQQLLEKEWNRIKDKFPAERSRIVPYPGGPQCMACKQLVKKVQVCAGCKMAIYCSPECTKQWWKKGHKRQCPATKRDGERIPKYKEIVQQFPWTDAGWNAQGYYMKYLVWVQFGVLGSSREKVGYWAVYERTNQDTWDEILDSPWGRQLTEEEGWKLATKFIPSLAPKVCPSFPPTFDDNWTSYYQWRRLPIESPAAILLQWPLSVYACLKELGLVKKELAGPRRKLRVDYIGLRDEFGFIPVFGELALLFPNTDLDLVMFGEHNSRAFERAKSRGLAPQPCVFEYTAPSMCGGGTIRIFIDPSPPYYRPSRDPSDHPDAIVALNAGLGSFISWQHVILLSIEFDIPFAVTDYCEASLAEVKWEVLQQGVSSTLPPPKGIELIHYHAMLAKVLKEVRIADVEKVSAALERERPAKLNEFMEPSQRTAMHSLSPGSSNGVIQVVTRGTAKV
ncbi:hypothetical protein C8F04DRAFT_1028632 [Mycena alexandri]|uniref:MYND-type domain-containing protein n=1 Tax=Mycena alexandri TaxID=1745969 RepID=A0AAD6TD01_9AGAR|nr:hypothetical protein C8F04DRAFT_1028632 [Mycena alexandri]